ncbi:hypothetical protein N7462_011148 [Penicillium macrosclerotiorum]|uniref:uncharacterized protein n=1 Tax=Penicillium macrosclerotiorum TaxID=303699 RepID=UPI002547455D|nr:uncharacterized protein N7462_011148 [Penicillium macrosclerotiorum]KAJ5666739.1 hypothetical protein N7462_011148 [Penicillium macrosclerotiorum]
MSRRVLVLDGLWYSLCPAFTPLALNRPNPLLRLRKQSSRPCPSPVPRIAATSQPRRCCSSNARRKNVANTRTDLFSNDKLYRAPPSSDSALYSLQHDDNLVDTDSNISHFNEPQTRQKPNTWLKVPPHLRNKTVSELETLLQGEMVKNPRIQVATDILRALIRDHHVQPSARHYKALMLANTDSQRGSPDFVRSLLAEMERDGIAADSGTLHAALQVLAVHPDYLLRQEVLRKLRDRWLTLSPAGWHFVVAGLLREHQFELALEQVTLMERKDIHVENWLHSAIIYHLCDFEEFDEVLRLMQARVSQGHDMTHMLWNYVLEKAGMAQHYALTRFVWQRMVELGYLRPRAEKCRIVLGIAAGVGDNELANSVFRYLTSRGTPLDLQDYERLIEAHIGAGRLYTAFDVLCTMHKAGIFLGESSTRSVLAYMIQNKIDRREAWQMLKRLKNEGRSIPLGCVHVIAQLCEHDALADPSVVDDAVGFYKELYTLYPDGADVSVYNTLVQMCRRARKLDAGMFLVKEMAALRVMPNTATFEAIILMCLSTGNYKPAFMYFQDLIKRGGSIGLEARKEIGEICSQSMDEFAMRIHYHPSIQEPQGSSQTGHSQQEADSIKKLETPKANRDANEDGPEMVKRARGHGRTNDSEKARIAYNRDRRRRKRFRLAMERWEQEELLKSDHSTSNHPASVDGDSSETSK